MYNSSLQKMLMLHYFELKKWCLGPFPSIYCLVCCINKWWSLITFMKMNLKLLLFYTTSNGNTITLEWIAKTNQVCHSTYSRKSKSKKFLFIRTMLAFHSTENWLSFPDLFVFFILCRAIILLLCNSVTDFLLAIE